MKHAFARRLRRDQTDVERKLWGALRNRQLSGAKFRRQQPIGPYVVDFLCCEARLVIELDGSQHDRAEALAHDEVRSRFLEERSYCVMRFQNPELIENFDGVMETIFRALQARGENPTPAAQHISEPRPASLSLKGRG